MRDQRTDQRRLADAGRPGDPDREGRAGLRIQLLEHAPGRRRRGSRRARSPAPRPACRPLARRRRVGRESTGGGPSAPLYGTSTSVSDSRRRSSQVVGSSRMLGQLTAQFAIVRVPEHRGYRNLLLARLISALGTWTAFFAVRIAIYNQTGSAWWVSILLFCELVPSVILGIAIGPLIDRWPRQRMMIFSDLGGAATFAVLPFVHSPAAICALSAVAGFSAAFFRPACYSAIPNLVAQGIARRRERARPGRREHRDADRARPRGRRRRAARLEHRLRASTRSASSSPRCSSCGSATGSSRPCRPGSAARTGARFAPGSRSCATTATCRRSP